MNFVTIIKKTKIALYMKIATSIMMQGLLLIIPVYWSRSINHVTDKDYNIAFKLIIVTLILSLLYYFWSYLNQRAWYNYYNKLYIECTEAIKRVNPKEISLGEYTNIVNNDIDIIGTFIGNGVTRIIQILEFFVIYIYFLKVDFIIFIITVSVSILMVIIIIYFGPKIEIKNKVRKETLDEKTIKVHNIYEILKKKDKTNNDSLIKSTIKYLNANAKFNIFVNSMIYLVLGFIELCRYGIVIYAIYLVSIGNMEIGTILLIYSYYAKIITNFEVLGTIHAEYQSFKVSLNRLNKLIKKN